MLSDYQLKIADLYNIPVGNVKKLVPKFFDKKNIFDSLWKLATLLKIRIEAKKIYCILGFYQSHWLKQYVEFNTHKKNRSRKKWWQRWKNVVQINENAVYGKTMENFRNRIDVKLVSKKKDYLN